MKKHFGVTGLVVVGLVVVLAACTNVPVPRARPEAGASPQSAWAAVLSRHVDDTGRIDFSGVSAKPQDLEVFVAWLATTSPAKDPGAFPSREARLAYWLNAYNALAMYNVVRSGIPPELDSIKVRFFGLTRFTIGGKAMSLNTLETRVVRPIGDPRVHFALNCMVRGCPRLPRVPFEAKRLEEQLDVAAKLFLNEERNVQLLSDRSTVRFSDILRVGWKPRMRFTTSSRGATSGRRCSVMTGIVRRIWIA